MQFLWEIEPAIFNVKLFLFKANRYYLLLLHKNFLQVGVKLNFRQLCLDYNWKKFVTNY